MNYSGGQRRAGIRRMRTGWSRLHVGAVARLLLRNSLLSLPPHLISVSLVCSGAVFVLSVVYLSFHSTDTASEGMRRSPRGESATEPTFGPSGMQERLNCWLKKRRQKVCSQCVMTWES